MAADEPAPSSDAAPESASSAAIPGAAWPASLPEQVAAVARVLAASSGPLSLADLAASSGPLSLADLAARGAMKRGI